MREIAAPLKLRQASSAVFGALAITCRATLAFAQAGGDASTQPTTPPATISGSPAQPASGGELTPQAAPPALQSPAQPPVQPTAPSSVPYEQRPQVLEFIDSMVAKHQFERGELINAFAHARYSASAAKLISPPVGGPPLVWSEYRARFLDPQRIEAGVQFWLAHRDDLARAETIYGVPPEIVVGILGVETIYGRNTGKIRVLDSLTTLTFDYPNKDHDRSSYFRGELEQFLILARANNLDVTSIHGSFAGAIGMPQFMPDSYVHYAVDFDGDGTVNLQDSAADSIGSVAHYLAERGWQRGAPIYLRTQLVSAQPDAAAVARLVAAGAEPTLSEADLKAAGFAVIDDMAPDLRVALVDLPDGVDGTRYVLGARNYYVVTRYNRSYAYAMAVIELGETIKASVAAQQ